jgi:Fe-Mn family superoxide dismutase
MERRTALKGLGLASGAVASGALGAEAVRQASRAVQGKEKSTMPGYEAKDFSRLLGMEGFSDTLLKNHFTLYQGYVTNTNKLFDALGQMTADGKAATPDFAELKRRLGWEFNGMRLHELYFDNLGGKTPVAQGGKLAKALQAGFGGLDKWEADFKATGSMRGIGWTILYQDNVTGRLFNQWINEHDVGHPVGCIPLLILDVFEHAFMVDYGLKRADYIGAFFKNINWPVVEGRIR